MKLIENRTNIERLENEEPLDLWSLLQQCQYHETSEAKDRLYSVLGMASDADSAPRPDYSPSTYFHSVFRDIAVYSCKSGKTIELINPVCSLGLHVSRPNYPS